MSPHGTANRYQYWKCRCDVCRVAQTERSRKARDDRYAWTAAHGLPPGIEHGLGAYSNWGCRCEVCKVAQVEKNRRDRHNRLDYTAEKGLPPEGITHGRSAYTAWGCRCEVCREAHRMYQVECRERRNR